MPAVPFILKNWKLIAGGAALLAFGIYVALLKADVQHWQKKAERLSDWRLTTTKAVQRAGGIKTELRFDQVEATLDLLGEKVRGADKVITEGRERVSANAAALTAVQPAVRALAASAAALRASAGRKGEPCVASDAAKMAWGDL